MKRILVVGASSFIGSNLCVALRKNHRVFGTYFSHKVRVDGVACFPLLLRPQAQLESFVNFLKPDVLIYCAAERDESKCRTKPLEALFVNAEAPALMAGNLQRWGGRLIYFSSAKVFSGEEGKYREENAPEPNSSYGSSKWQAERRLEEFENVFILRLGTAYGIAGPNQDSMFNRLLSSFWRREPTSLISDELRSFVSVKDICRFVECLIDADESQAGTYHVGTLGEESYFTFAESVAKIFHFSPELIRPISGAKFSGQGFTQADRGRDLTLDGSHFRDVFGLVPTPTELALRAIHQNLQRGKQ